MSTEELEEYLSNRRFKDGLSKCNKLLKKTPSAPGLLIYKAKFLRGLGRPDEAKATIDAVMKQPSPFSNVNSLLDIEEYFWEPLSPLHPRPLTLGTEVNALWTTSAAAAPRQNTIGFHHTRFDNSVEDRRWIDAGYALSNWRKADPNNRTLRLLHAAVYQLISENLATDAKTAMMNALLAIRTLDQNTDAPFSETELLLYCQICNRQKSPRKILDRLKPIVTSPQCTWSVFREYRLAAVADQDWEEVTRIMTIYLGPSSATTTEGVTSLNDMAGQDWASWEALLQAHHALGRTDELPFPTNNRRFLDLSKLWLQSRTDSGESLAHTLSIYWETHKTAAFCYDDVKDYLLALPVDQQSTFRKDCLDTARTLDTVDMPAQHFGRLIAGINALRLEYLLNTARSGEDGIAFLRNFVRHALKMHEFAGESFIAALATLICAALLLWHSIDPSGEHLLEAIAVMDIYAAKDIYQAKVLLVYLYAELGLYSEAILWYDDLSIKEMQHETFSHALLSRISISRPLASSIKASGRTHASNLVDGAVYMYQSNRTKLDTFSKMLVNNGRPDMLLELQDLQKCLDASITKRNLLLEQRRLNRLTNRQPKEPVIQEDFQRWQLDLSDSRDYKTTANHDRGDTYLDYHFQGVRQAPNASWILYNLWIEETWSSLQNTPYLVRPFVQDNPKALDNVSEDPCLTTMEQCLVPHWRSLGILTTLATSATAPTSTQPLSGNFAKEFDQLCGVFARLPVSQVLESNALFATMPGYLIQNTYLLLDYLRALNLFLRTFSKSKATQSALPLNKVQPLLTQIQIFFNDLQKCAKTHKVRQDAAVIRKGLESSAVGKYVDVANVAKKISESATDGWDGVLKVVLDAQRY